MAKSGHVLYDNAKDIYNDFYDIINGVRLIGVFSNRLVEKKEEPKQISIFDDLDEIERKEALKKLLNDINNQYGKNSIKKGL